MNEPQPRYVANKEAVKDGFFPDEIHEEINDIPGPMPIIVEGKPFEAKSGIITVEDETLELPPHLRQTAQVIELGEDGEFHARPATPSERGGGIRTGKTAEEFTPTHHKASHKILPTPK